MRHRSNLRCALVYPPFTDPTCGYHSLPYLAAAVRASRDYEISIIDANIEALVWCARPANVLQLQNGIDEKLWSLKQTATWDIKTFQAYRDAAIGAAVDSAGVSAAMELLRDPLRFWDYAAYRKAVLTLERWLRLLATQGRPGMFEGFALSGVNLYDSGFFSDAANLDSLGGPFRGYFREELIPRLERAATDVVGIGVTYRRQLPFALYLARQIAEMLPNVRVVLGGTDISQFWKVAKNTDAFRALLGFADAVVIGEGERAFIDILDAYATGREPEGAGIISRSCDGAGAGWGPRYENVDALPTPSFRDLPWDLYLSPQRLVCYSPTRGCYWDKCTFCDYGLAGDRPTSPWRQRSIPHAVEDLKAISRESKFVYFSVDVLAPAYLVNLARAIVDNRIEIKWSAELRLERYFDDSHCALLRESGCVAVSVGFESGNQRVLDLIDKGTKVEEVRRVVRSLSRAGIGVQIMGFTGFPTETYGEALESVSVLEDLRQDWVFGGLGTFSLTSGSIVARQPDKFGLVSVRPRSGDDLHRKLTFEEERPSKTAEERIEIERRCDGLRHPFQLGRPFVGGIDTAHTLFYLDRYGRQTRAQLHEALGPYSEDACLLLEGRIVRDAPPEARSFLDTNPSSGSTRKTSLLATENGRLITCPAFVELLAPLLDGRLSTQGVIDSAHEMLGVSPESSALVLRYLRERHLLRFVPAAHVEP